MLTAAMAEMPTNGIIYSMGTESIIHAANFLDGTWIDYESDQTFHGRERYQGKPATFFPEPRKFLPI